MRITQTIIIFLLFFLMSCASKRKAPHIPCHQDKARQAARSEELLKILAADQSDRSNWEKKNALALYETSVRDIIRRKRVGEIFGEGCFLTPTDFAAGAMVYQHGEVPEHYYQAFVWANRAVELGDYTQKNLMAHAIDRYLVSIGKKQLFGTQAFKSDVEKDSCWCLQKTELSFPDHRRQTYTERTLNQTVSWVKQMNKGKRCPKIMCEKSLDDSPKGTVPGFW